MHSEAVFWILGRSAILATIFSLGFLFCYLKKYEANVYFAGYILFFIISLLTYESSWMLPLYALIAGSAEIKNRKATWQREAKHLAIVVGIFILYLATRLHYINEISGNYESGAFLKGDYTTLLKNYSILFIRSFLPAFINNKLLIICFSIIGLIAVFLFFKLEKLHKKRVYVFFLCYLISLLPYGSLGVDTHGTESERFLYFPTLLVCILFGLTSNLSYGKKIFRTVFYLLIFSCHLVLLFITATDYGVAGSVNKLIISELQKANAKKNIYAIDLPQSQNGALILRSGFTEMTKWMFDDKFDTAIICSKRSELKPLHNPYHVIYSDQSRMNCANANWIVDPANSVILRFTDSTLYITK